MSNKLDWTESQEIADHILEVENPELEQDLTNNALFEKWGIDLELFHEIASEIFERMDFAISPLSKIPYVGISDIKSHWIAKKEVTQQFISGLIQWITEGKNISPKSQGLSKVITREGVPVFEVIIRKQEPHSSRDIARRTRIDLNTEAELAIRKAMHEVEKLPASVTLTNAVAKLNEAFNLVADFVEENSADYFKEQKEQPFNTTKQ